MSNCIPLLMNASAGAMHALSCEGELQRMASRIDLQVKIIPTESPEQMRLTLKRLVAEGEPKVAVAGGDGTIGIAIQELAHTDTALGILSQGTFNNFASVLRIPHNLPAALRLLRDGIVKSVDLGKVGDQYFAESAGVGLFADALTLYGQGSNKNLLRTLYAIARLWAGFHTRKIELIIDGKRHPERVVLCEVANTYRIGQALPIAPEADIHDGLLDIVIIGDIKRRDLMHYLGAIRAQMHLDLPHVTTLRAKEIRLEAGRPKSVHCDDHIIGKTPITIAVQPDALKVLTDTQL